jgi:predicted acyl esterase
MLSPARRVTLAIGLAIVGMSAAGVAQRGGSLSEEQRTGRWDTEKELQSLAVVHRKVMMPMRDGVRLATDVYVPKNAGEKVPAIVVKTP